MLFSLLRKAGENNAMMAVDTAIIAPVLMPFLFLNKRIPPFDRDDLSSSLG